MIVIGDKAPDFSLSGVLHEKIQNYSLKTFKDKWIVLFFYPKDFTFVCPTEVKAFNQLYPDFKKSNCEVLGVSVDPVEMHREWVKELGGLNYPLLSDADRSLTKSYGVLDSREPVAHRASFIIDPSGIIQCSAVYNSNVGRSVEETLRVLKALQTGRMCPADWHPGQETYETKLKY